MGDAEEADALCLPVHDELLGNQSLVANGAYVSGRLLHHHIPTEGVETLSVPTVLRPAWYLNTSVR